MKLREALKKDYVQTMERHPMLARVVDVYADSPMNALFGSVMMGVGLASVAVGLECIVDQDYLFGATGMICAAGAAGCNALVSYSFAVDHHDSRVYIEQIRANDYEVDFFLDKKRLECAEYR
ncbi:hypothetical protein HQ545_07330 [Candidatus Woesearchaeota archaeon]|nr:hypothetical protein [Candidatus Woesearchaeota archaeon]